MISKSVWLIGTSPLADEYLKVLSKLGKAVVVIGRTETGAKAFYDRTGVMPLTGGLQKFLSQDPEIPVGVINAVDVASLYSTTKLLLNYGIKRILVEKPGGLNISEIQSMKASADYNNTEIFIAYNRRFFGSIMKARQIVNEDCGALYCRFDFTEASDQIEGLKTKQNIKEKWLYGNSTHVIDTVFHLIGCPKSGTYEVSGADELDWHSSGSVFRGFGESITGCKFSYHSDWRVPGRWSIEIATKKHKMLLCPMEELQIMKRGSFAWESIKIASLYDQEYKPGFFEQVKSFLNFDVSTICTLSEHAVNFNTYKDISSYRE